MIIRKLVLKLTPTIFIMSLVLTMGGQALAESHSVTLIQVEDGDTLIVKIDGQRQRIQLIGIDAPEDTDNAKLKVDSHRTSITAATLQKIGGVATDYLQTLVKPGDILTLRGDLTKRDKYGRIPGNIINSSGKSLSEAMVTNGYALTLSAYPVEEKLKSALLEQQATAITAKRGLWGSHSDIVRAWSGLRDL